MGNSFGITLLFAWLWIFLGFASGLVLGLHFHKEDWLGGYNSFKRRLYRLAHISFFGLGAVNFLFYFTAQKFGFATFLANAAASAFIVGGVTMPLCCVLMAHNARMRMLFGVPVLSLMFGGICTILEVAKL